MQDYIRGYFSYGKDYLLKSETMPYRKAYTAPKRKRTGGYATGRYKRKRARYRGGRSTVITQELKFRDHQITDAIVAATGSVTASFCLVGQGTTDITRIGRKIIVRSFSLRFLVTLPTLANQDDIQDGDVLRIIVFLDRQANGANAVVTDVLETAVYNSHRNLNNEKRFFIYMDRFVPLNRMVAATDGTNTNTSPQVVKQVNLYRKINVPVEFSGASGLIGEVTSNNLACLYISANGLCGVTDQESRIRYDG